MPIRNLWSLEPDECIVAEELTRQIPTCRIYFPLHDVGVDLLAVRGDRHIGLQVKGSRYYTMRRRGALPKEKWHSWHQIKAVRLSGDDPPDFYIFVTYLPTQSQHKEDRFAKKFLVVPSEELIKRAEAVKNKGKKGIYSFYFRFDDEKVTEIREQNGENEHCDYTPFSDRWDLIETRLNMTSPSNR